MSQNACQFADLQRVDPPEKSPKVRKIEFVGIYEPPSEGQVKIQADCYPSYDNPHCEWKCLAHNYILNWLKLANEGRTFETVELSHQTNTLLEIYGHVCPQDRLCEGSCTLNGEFGTVTIGNIERYINDKAFETGWCPDMSGVEQTDRKMAIIGTDPASLACVDVLTRNGIKTVVFGRHPEISGLPTLGILTSKLEGEVMTRCHGVFTGMGIEFKLNTEVGRDVQLSDLLSDYDAIFLSVGTYQSMRGGLENEDADGVYAALPFLVVSTKQLIGFGETNDEPLASMEGEHVVVLGDDGTVMDCVRTSIRQDTKRVTCAYRRDEESTPGFHREVKNVWGEGIEFKFNIQSLGIEVNGNGKVSGAKMVRTEVGEPDVKGRRCTEIVAGSEHTVPVDAVITVFGFRPHNIERLAKHNVELGSQGRIIAPEGSNNVFQTSSPKILAGGDIARGSDLVVTVIAEGRKAADGIID